MMTETVAAFYHFASLPDFRDLQAPLLAVCEDNDVLGSILLADEGINGTISGPAEGIDAVLAWIRSDPRLAATHAKFSAAQRAPFRRMKVRLKKEIVALGVPGINPNKRVGTYLPPEEWNKVISDPDVVVIDTRNDYEYAIGTFRRAVDPQTKRFRDFPEWVRNNPELKNKPKVAMFCTGGIRCEKATGFMLEEGFEEVYHLEGGILRYLEEVPEEQSLWEGQCFVFDERVSLGHGLEEGGLSLCRGCRDPLLPEDLEHPDYEEGVKCPHCAPTLHPKALESRRERARQVALGEERGERHLPHARFCGE